MVTRMLLPLQMPVLNLQKEQEPIWNSGFGRGICTSPIMSLKRIRFFGY
jgi:hypothetical protein